MAFEVTNNQQEDGQVSIMTGGASHVSSADTDPGYPVPELPTIILTSAGLLALVGFVVYSRRKNS